MTGRCTASIDVGEETIEFDWGEPFELGTAAYWVDQASRVGREGSFALGRSLAEEIAACLLGGHGVRAVVGLAAFDELRRHVELEVPPSPDDIIAVLKRPLRVDGLPRPIRYRFPSQRGERIAAALAELHAHEPPVEPRPLRDWLMRLPGIGPKTASWIVRNRTGSDEVAIIDIHIRRAGIAAGFFSPEWALPSAYALFEQAFLEVARIGAVPASSLDAHMWGEVQRLGRHARFYGISSL